MVGTVEMVGTVGMAQVVSMVRVPPGRVIRLIMEDDDQATTDPVVFGRDRDNIRRLGERLDDDRNPLRTIWLEQDGMNEEYPISERIHCTLDIRLPPTCFFDEKQSELLPWKIER